ncbi:MAG: hypothetical protein DHS80DRAFT_24799 [Piptocephalis tieghemiana]|nr:MAG: hypothetical protein DHS80DRAFT_24799 [Piptocephalis tieghemiana]
MRSSLLVFALAALLLSFVQLSLAQGGVFRPTSLSPEALETARNAPQPTTTSSSSSSASPTSASFGGKADKKQNITGSITELFLPPLNSVMAGNASADQKDMVAELIHLGTGLKLSAGFFAEESGVLGLITSDLHMSPTGYYSGRWSISTRYIQMNMPQVIVESSMTSDEGKSFLCLMSSPKDTVAVILAPCVFSKSPDVILWTIAPAANDPSGEIFQMKSSAGEDSCLGFNLGSSFPSIMSCADKKTQWTYYNVESNPSPGLDSNEGPAGSQDQSNQQGGSSGPGKQLPPPAH